MDAENLIVDDNAQGEKIKHVREVVPHVCVAVLARALGVESIRLSDSPRFMVAADEVDAVGVAKFQADKQRDCFHTEQTTINVVACRHSQVECGQA